MEVAEIRKNRHFTKGPVYDEVLDRHLVEIRYPDGSRRRKRFRREREATRWWAAEIAKIEVGTWFESAPKVITVGKAFDLYRKHAKVHQRSYERYAEPQLVVLERLLSRDTPLAKVTVTRVEEIQALRATTRKPATVDRGLAVLRAVFNWLIDRGHFNFNPVSKVQFFNPNNERVRYLNDDERAQLLRAADKGPWYLRPAIEIAENTGLRRANLLSLAKSQTDFVTRTIRITDTKNGETLAIPMNDRVVEILRDLAKRNLESPFYFPHGEDKYKGEALRNLKKSFRTALKEAKITDFKWHDLRHSFASRLVMGGVDLLSVQKLLGHRSARMTERYAHLSPEHLTSQIRVLDRVLPKVCPFVTSESGKSGHPKARRGRTRQRLGAKNDV